MNYRHDGSRHVLNPAAVRGAACLLAFAFCPLAQAATQVSVQANGPQPGNFQTQTAASGPVSVVASGSASGFSSAESANASFGVLSVYGEAHAPTTNNSSTSTFGFATASFKDDFLFDALGLTGQAGTFTFSLHIDGLLKIALKSTGQETSTTTFSYSGATFSLLQDGGSLINGSTRERLLSDGSTSNVGDPFLNRTSSFTVQFTFGTKFELQVGLGAQTNARGQFGADSIADIGHTLEWGGIASVKDSRGNQVNNYSLSTGSGTNYMQAIPEPGNWALLGAGVLTLGGIQRRRSAQAAIVA